MIGQTVAHYRIESRLGSGGMGVVYRAFDQQLQRPVALKFLPPHLSEDRSAKERFMQEARAASALDHANICTVHHIGETDDGQLYIVMSFYEGQTLKYRMQDGAMEESRALEVARQIAAGLAQAHDAGIVHRDIKPANIMVTDRGDVKILDFGVAKLESSADLTRAGSTVGTAAYMSPEQTRGDQVRPASDVWSLGVLLYEMLAGRRPFDAGYDQALSYAIANEEPAPIPGVSDETRSILGRLMTKDPADRVADGSAALVLLGGRAEPASAPAPSASPVRPASPTVGSTLAVFAGGAAITLAVVYAAMIRFGLPDWVLTLGALFLALGIPVLVFAARSERRRAEMDSGERRSLRGLPAWITVRRAWLGGGIALATLLLVSVGWMLMRAAGIGPAGTLMTRGVLSRSDRVLVADFDDQAGDGALGRTIAEALRIDLAQSPVVSLIDGSDVRAALERMQADPASSLTLSLAREVAQREGAKAIVAGEVAPLGSSYVISLRLLDAATGEELLPLRETADGDAGIVQAVDRLSGSLREGIGESLRTIRSGAPLEQVTTASLDALRHYTTGVTAFEARDFARVVEEFEEAIAIDSLFAMAYRKLAVTYNNMGTNLQDQYRLAGRAYELRNRLPEEERYLAEAWYFNAVVRDPDAVIATYRSMLERFPGHTTALNNLAVLLSELDRDPEAVAYAMSGIRSGEDPIVSLYENVIASLSDLGRADEADAYLDTFEAVFPGHIAVAFQHALVPAARSGDYRAGADSMASLRDRVTDPGVMRYVRGHQVRYLQYTGRLDEADALVDAFARSSAHSAPTQVLIERLESLIARLDATNDADGVAASLDDVLQVHPIEDMDALDRPYARLAYLQARLGRTEEARRLLDEQARLWPEPWVRVNFLRHKAAGMIALVEGDADAAVTHLRAARDVRFEASAAACQRCATYELALALRAGGHLEEAASVLDEALGRRAMWEPWQEFGVLGQEWRLLGDVNESLGHADEAIAAYERFLELWADVDPELQPQVREIQGRVDRLLAARSRERS